MLDLQTVRLDGPLLKGQDMTTSVRHISIIRKVRQLDSMRVEIIAYNHVVAKLYVKDEESMEATYDELIEWWKSWTV